MSTFFEFTYRTAKIAVRRYFEPLRWASRLIQRTSTRRDRYSKYFGSSHKSTQLGAKLIVHKTLPLIELRQSIAKAQDVFILQTWTCLIDQLSPELENAVIKNNTRIRVLLLDPGSPFVHQRGLAYSEKKYSGDVVQSRIHHALLSIVKLKEKLGSKGNNIEVHLYNQVPYMAAYVIDDVVYLGLYHYSAKRFGTGLIMRFEGIASEIYKSEFMHIWDNSSPPDLSSLLTQQSDITEDDAAIAPEDGIPLSETSAAIERYEKVA